MWTRSFKKRQTIPIRGTGFLGNRSGLTNLDEMLKWEGGHVIAVVSTSNSLALYTNLYEVNSAVIQISNQKEHWLDRINEGVCYVVTPGLQRAVGPIDLAELLAHKYDADYENHELKQLEQLMSEFDELPPFDI